MHSRTGSDTVKHIEGDTRLSIIRAHVANDLGWWLELPVLSHDRICGQILQSIPVISIQEQLNGASHLPHTGYSTLPSRVVRIRSDTPWDAEKTLSRN